MPAPRPWIHVALYQCLTDFLLACMGVTEPLAVSLWKPVSTRNLLCAIRSSSFPALSPVVFYKNKERERICLADVLSGVGKGVPLQTHAVTFLFPERQ